MFKLLFGANVIDTRCGNSEKIHRKSKNSIFVVFDRKHVNIFKIVGYGILTSSANFISIERRTTLLKKPHRWGAKWQSRLPLHHRRRRVWVQSQSRSVGF